jgi:hypothetical protein
MVQMKNYLKDLMTQENTNFIAGTNIKFTGNMFSH